ncbi:MAG: RibD family protein [Chloroflexi bacterium]|nr:RibD family protein [Chloroflexota bacterium]
MAKPDYTSFAFPAPPGGRPYVVINMVMSVDGKTVIEETEAGIGSAVDQRLMRELRVNADVVLAGAGTLRASGASSRLGDPALEAIRTGAGKPPSPVAAVVSRMGDLPLERIFFTARDFDAVVYLSAGCPEERAAAVVATGRPVVRLPAGAELPAMLRHMRDELGASVVLVEGGPEINAGLFAIDAVDELFLTLGPVVVGGRATLSGVGGDLAFTRETAPRLDLLHAIPNPGTGEVYLRYRVRR